MATTELIHRFEMGANIKHGSVKAIVMGVGTDDSGMVSYLLSIFTFVDSGWRRHWVTELELQNWEIDRNA